MKTFDDPATAIESLAACLNVIGTERSAPVAGRVLAEPILADRDSPAADVSAMDGFAIRLVDLNQRQIVISDEIQPGQSPLSLPPGTAVRIFTGAVVPAGTEAVVMREQTDESVPGLVTWLDGAKTVARGESIRVQGENGKAGDEVVAAGTLLTSGSIAASANFGAAQVLLHRPVRVAIIVTGNELLDTSAQPTAWQLRDSNGPTIAAACAQRSWIVCQSPVRCPDDAGHLEQQLSNALREADAVILTGGVSKGDYDHVPGVIAGLSAKIIFHRLPIRPGRPILGAVSAAGQLILGLPGNPVSALVGMTRFGIPLLAKQSGQRDWQAIAISVAVSGPIEATLPLHWYRLVRVTSPDAAELVDSRGSGDLVALAHSTGFIYQPPSTSGPGPWAYYSW